MNVRTSRDRDSNTETQIIPEAELAELRMLSSIPPPVALHEEHNKKNDRERSAPEPPEAA